MLPILWRNKARHDLLNIISYIGERDLNAAMRLSGQIEAVIQPLSEHPYLYRQSDRVPSLREIVAHPNYIILYRVTAWAVEVVTVLHARQKFP